MKVRRRFFLQSVAAAGAAVAAPYVLRAQAWPARPVHIIVGFSPGGATDVVARLIGQWLSDRLGQSFIVENRTGANSNIAAEAVVNATADGYTLLMAGTANVVNTTLYDKLSFVFHRDIAPVASIGRVPAVLDVNPSVPATTVPEFIAYAKANPRKLSMGSGGLGSPQHIAGELFKMMAGVDLVPVHYRGGAPAVADLLGGRVQADFDILLEAIEHIKSGKLRPLAVTTVTRAPLLPEVPTVGDFLPGYEASFWWGVGAPRHTPASIIDRLNREINAGLADPRLSARVTDLAATVLAGSPQEFAALIAADTEKWGKVVRAGNMRVE
ncbi:MAG: tripartite tricarboxylate transporter substrate binding protein [Bradyrhizobiaceae bacterium]|nr:tripartite tricarboxylate transporter substrate binding protein [Bradyrhizobiaceae bacterium]